MKSLTPYSTTCVTRIPSPSRSGGGKGVGILFLLISLSLFSCSSDDDTPKDTDYAKTVFIYMPWTGSETSSFGSLLNFFNKNLSDIQSAMKSDADNHNVRTIVFLASDSNNGSLFEMKPDGTKQTIKEYDSGEMTTTQALSSLLTEVYSYSPTPTFSMIIGSHADGWLPAGSIPQHSRSFGGQTKAMKTDIETLAEAIESSPIKKMQYVCFDDCYMANVETTYAMRNATNWLIASTSEIMEDGLPYGTIWKYLSAVTPDYSKIVDGYGAFYSTFSSPYGSLATIDCSKIGNLADLMRNFNKKYDQISSDQLRQVQVLDGYSNHVFYDLGNYVSVVCNGDTASNSALFQAISQVAPYKFCTPELYTVYQIPSTYSVSHFSGITISDPSQNAAAIDAKKQTAWWKATH